MESCLRAVSGGGVLPNDSFMHNLQRDRMRLLRETGLCSEAGGFVACIRDSRGSCLILNRHREHLFAPISRGSSANYAQAIRPEWALRTSILPFWQVSGLLPSSFAGMRRRRDEHTPEKVVTGINNGDSPSGWE